MLQRQYGPEVRIRLIAMGTPTKVARRSTIDHVENEGVGKMRPVRLRLISASNNCRVKVRIWVRFRFRVKVRVRVRVGRLIQVA